MTDWAETFIDDIEDIVWMEDVTYMDALIHYSEDKGLEPETVGEMVSNTPLIKRKVRIEAEEVHLVPTQARLKL